MRKGAASRILAYVLALCMIIGSIAWPDITAKAETITLDLKPDTSWQTVTAATDEWSEYGKAEIRFSPSSDLSSMKAIADAGYKTLKITYAVDTFTVASGQNAGVMPFASYGSEWKNNDTWVDLSKAGQFETVLDLSAISTTSTEKVAFGIQVANLQAGSTIKFRIVSAVLAGTKSSSGGSGSSGESGGSGGSGQESADLDAIGSTSANVTASLADGNGTAKGDGYYETEITINNKSNSYIADWIAVADVSGSVTAVKDYSSWSDLKGVYSGGKMYIYPNTSKKSGAVSAGSSVSYSKLGYTGAANQVSLTGVKVYYSSSSGAFDSFINSLSSTSGGAGDNTGEINTDVEYNYAKLLQESLYFYDANMCGKDVSAKSEFSWRSNCHTEDATATYNGKTIDVSGGYHDAGDHAKFMMPQAYSATALGLARMEFAEAFADTATEAHYKRIMDRFVDFFERCTVIGSDGAVEAVCYQVGNGTNDHNYWGAPEQQSSRSGETLFSSSSNTCTDVAAEMAAALAAYYINYKDSKALSYAEKLFTYADKSSKMTSTSVPGDLYASSSWDDDYALAAALLYKATKKSEYVTKYNSVYGNKSNPNWVFSWDNVAPAALLYSPNGSGKAAFVENQKGMIQNNTKSNDNNYFFLNQWGSARYNTAHQMMGLIYDQMYSKTDYSSWANGQMKYILGNNAGSKCFVVGYNKYSSKYPHHRAASGYYGGPKGTTTQTHVLTGALVGGPTDTSSNYNDTADDYTANEVALDYNAGLVGAAAGLYLYVKNNGTDEEKAVQKVVPKSEVSSELRTISGESGGSTTTEATTEGTTGTTKVTTEGTTGTTEETTGTTEETTGTTEETTGTTEETTGTTEETTGTTEETTGSTDATTEKTEEKTETTTEIPVVKVTGITFDRDKIALSVGDSDEIKATVTPGDAADTSLVWSSSDISKVSVQNGRITALAAGTATITATAKDGSGVKAKCIVTVRIPGTLSCKTESLAWDKLVYGYQISDSENIVLENSGEDDLTGVRAELKSGTAFQIVSSPASQISAGQETTVAVKPVNGLDAGSYSDTLTISAANSSVNITLKATVAKGGNTSVVTLTKTSVTSDTVTVSGQESVASGEIEYAISGEKDADASKLVWQNEAQFTGLKEFTTYYVYGRVKETANVKAGQISQALEVTTPLSDPFVIDIGRLNDSRYVGALTDSEGKPTVKVSESGGVTSVSFIENKDYTITGNDENVIVDTGNASGITVDKAVVKKITVRPGNSGTFVIKVSGENRIADGITCVSDNSNTADVKISGKDTSSKITATIPEASAVKAEGNLEIDNIQIKSDGKGIEAAGTVKISGGSNSIESVSSAISASDVEITGGSVDAKSSGLESGESVISADNSIKLTGGNITADATGSTGGTSFGVKSDDGTIIVDGDVSIGGEPTYSKDPVDSKGDSVTMVKVVFTDENGNQLYSSSVNKGATLDLAKVSIIMSDGTDYKTSRGGYALTWKDVNGTSYSADSVYGAVSEDITFKAVWTWIVVDISVDASITFAATGNTAYKTTYTGAAVRPAVKVVSQGKTLDAGTDYTVSYSNNTNAGTARAVVKGQGKYKGLKTITFAINKQAISKAAVTITKSAIYTGKEITPAVKVACGKRTLAAGRDYRISYSSNKDFGKAKVVITGIGNYSGSKTQYFDITAAVGKTYTNGNYRYKITNASLNGKGTVTLVSVVKKTKTVAVPDTIKLGGRTFKVTAIGKAAFSKNVKVTKITLGRNVKTIGARAFYGCKKLRTVVIKNTQMTGKTVGAKAFKGTHAKLTVKVPAKKLKSYKKILLNRGVSKKAVIKK